MHETEWGVVLAGGRSRRLGLDKAAVEIGGTSLLEHAVGTLRKVFEEVEVIGRPKWSGGRGLPDEEPGQGPLGGILTALRHRPGRSVFVLACDLPEVDDRLVRWLLERSHGEERGPVTYPSVGGVSQPLCGVWSAGSAPAVERALAAGRRSVRALLDRLEAAPVELEPSHPVYRPNLLANLNRPGDLALFGATPPPESRSASA